jgi:uncharacterized protein (UPF0332 family)
MQHSLKDLCKHRFEKAQEALASSKHNLDFELKTSLNRSYYAILYATRALLAADGLDAHSHRGLFVVFNKEYIKTGIFDKNFSRILKEASFIRDKSDYKDFYIVSRDDAKEQVQNAEFFLSEVSKYLQSKLGISLENKRGK